MCEGVYSNANSAYQAAASQPQGQPTYYKPEQRIADIISKEAGVYLNPTVIRLIVKYNWRELSKAAHEIHGS